MVIRISGVVILCPEAQIQKDSWIMVIRISGVVKQWKRILQLKSIKRNPNIESWQRAQRELKKNQKEVNKRFVIWMRLLTSF